MDIKETKEFKEVEKALKHPLLDPKNPLWLDILRYTILVIVGLLTVSVTISFILTLLQGEILLALGVLIGGAISILVFYILGMISLNTLFNIQQIRINTDEFTKIVKIK